MIKTMENEEIQKGTMIRQPRIGRRINIIVLGHVDNDQTGTLYALFEKYGLKNKVLFGHYGRPTKCKRELDAWFAKYLGEDNIKNKLERADEDLEKGLKLIKSKLVRADELLSKKS